MTTGHPRQLSIPCLPWSLNPLDPHSCLLHSDIRFTASLDEWTAGARAAFDGSGQRLPPRRLRLSVGNVTCEQLHFHVLVRRGCELLSSGPGSEGKAGSEKEFLLDFQKFRLWSWAGLGLNSNSAIYHLCNLEGHIT